MFMRVYAKGLGKPSPVFFSLTRQSFYLAFYLSTFITHLEVIRDSRFSSDDKKLITNRVENHFAAWSRTRSVRSFNGLPSSLGYIKYPEVVELRGVVGSTEHVNKLSILVERVCSMRAWFWSGAEVFLLRLQFGKFGFVLLLCDKFLDVPVYNLNSVEWLSWHSLQLLTLTFN